MCLRHINLFSYALHNRILLKHLPKQSFIHENLTSKFNKTPPTMNEAKISKAQVAQPREQNYK